MRPAEAAARWPIMIIMPSIRNGGCSISTYELKAPIVPTVVPLLQAGDEAYARWRATNVRAQKHFGYLMATVSVPLGDLTSAQMRVLGELARAFGDGAVRVTPDQNLVFRWINACDLRQLYKRVAAAGLQGAVQLDDLEPGRVAVFLLAAGDDAPLAMGSALIGDRDVTPVSLSPVRHPGQAATFDFDLYKGEYYDNKPTELLADLVNITQAPKTGIDFSLSEAGGSCSGTVRREGTYEPVSGVVVIAVGISSVTVSFG